MLRIFTGIGSSESDMASGDFIASERTADALFDVLVQQLAVGVIVVDADGRMLSANGAARQFLAPSGSRLDTPLVVAMEGALGRVLLTGEIIRDDEITICESSGEQRWYDLSISPVPAAPDSNAAAVLTITDVTAQKQRDCWRRLVDSLSRL